MALHARALLVAVLVVLAAPAAASASRTSYPTLTLTQGSDHFLVHYKTTYTVAEYSFMAADVTVDLAYVNGMLGHLENAWARLVTGGGGVPNAGLRAPVSDAGPPVNSDDPDGRVDVFVIPMSYASGAVAADNPAGPTSSASIRMDPRNPAGDRTRFVAAHEFMHVLQDAYTTGGGLATESTADWGPEWAVPEIDVGDSQFRAPHLPLECVGTWGSPAEECGNGYGKWLFVQQLVERYGVGVVGDWLTRLAAYPPAATEPVQRERDRTTLNALATANGSSLSQEFMDYAARMWDPTAWTTTAVKTLFAGGQRPAATPVELSRSAPTAGATATVNHLASRYVELRNLGVDPAGPDDRIRITVSGGDARVLVGDRPNHGRTTVPCPGGGSPCATVSADPARVSSSVLALTNADGSSDTGTKSFTWSAQLLPGTPTPPANDTRDGATPVTTGVPVATDTAYAGGAGETEAPSCGPGYTTGARRGVWFRWTAPAFDRYVFDATGTDYLAPVAAYVESTGKIATCVVDLSRGEAGPRISHVHWNKGTTVLIYIGRSKDAKSDGHTARLTITRTGDYPDPAPATPKPPAATPAPSPSLQTSRGLEDSTAPRMRLLTTAVKADRKRRIAFRLACPTTELRCTGTLSLRTTRRIRFGSVRFSIARGRTVTVRITLTKKSAKALRRLRRVKVGYVLTARDAAGNTRTTRGTVTVRGR